MQQQQGFDVKKLCREAHTRWLKPTEVLFILQNHEIYIITPQPPQKPPSGSLFLFNRRVLRFFRKDGHTWRRKKDGRPGGEAHEKLKVGNLDALSCYYAHGEPNSFFQRRIYWMLDPAYEHIVLVHYREVSEGRYISNTPPEVSAESFSVFSQKSDNSSNLPQGFLLDSSDLQKNYQRSFSPASLEEVSSEPFLNHLDAVYSNAMYSWGQSEANQELEELAEQLNLDGNNRYLNGKQPECSNQYKEPQNFDHLDFETLRNLENQMPGQVDESETQDYFYMQSLVHSGGDGKHEVYDAAKEVPDSSNCRRIILETSLPTGEILNNENDKPLHTTRRDNILENLTWQLPDDAVISPQDMLHKHHISADDLALQISETRRFLLDFDNPLDSSSRISGLSEFDILHASDTSTLPADSSMMTLRKENTTYCLEDIDLSTENSMYSFDVSEMLMDPSQCGSLLRTDPSLTLAQKQQFSICEISPEWAFSWESTKVIITGNFLCKSSEFPWVIMFGDMEVPAQVVQEGVLRCQTPQHGPGKVTLCVTSGNRESCSEIREFEFHEKPNTSIFPSTSSQAESNNDADELLLLARFSHILLCGYDLLFAPKGGLEKKIEKMQTDDGWIPIFQALEHGSECSSDALRWILQELLKDKFQHWLMSKYQGQDCAGCMLSKEERGIIHMIAGLGYEWALNPILDSGVGINFRDAKGWTALHWAARFGRENMAAALLAAGASAGAVTDPTPQDPVGKTPGAISAAFGHKGLAGYLSEVDVTSHLSSLTIGESEISKGSAAVEAERVVESISQKSPQLNAGGTEDELSFKDSLAAVRNVTQAAARIQAAFRAHSFRKRQQQAASSRDDYGMTPDDRKSLSAALKIQRAFRIHRDQKFDKAALSIQKKYRGWKGRKEFLTLRRHVVKIQAHVRGHQVRKMYREFLWSVGVIEKVILRWRRKGVGLRGFRAETEFIDEEDEDIIKVFRKKKVDAALDQAVVRVFSMVDTRDARQQYRRMLERYRQAKAMFSDAAEASRRQHL